MLNPGFVTRKALTEWQDVPSLLPQFQFHEKHRAVITTLFPEKILSLVAGFDIQKEVVIHALMSVRQLPQKLQSSRSRETLNSFGLQNFTLLTHSASELCYGLRGQFWRADFGLETVPDASAYQLPTRPGGAKLLLRYQVKPLVENEYELLTETFIHCPDRASHLKMAVYWLAIRAGSGLIRKRMLEAVKSSLDNKC